MQLASWLPPVFCYTADHPQFSNSHTFMRLGWMLSYFMEWA